MYSKSENQHIIGLCCFSHAIYLIAGKTITRYHCSSFKYTFSIKNRQSTVCLKQFRSFLIVKINSSILSFQKRNCYFERFDTLVLDVTPSFVNVLLAYINHVYPRYIMQTITVITFFFL